MGEINIDSFNEEGSLKYLPIDQNSLSNLCVIGTQMHLFEPSSQMQMFETPRFGRTSNFGNILFNSHGIEDTGDEQGESMMNREGSRKALGFEAHNTERNQEK